MAYNTKTRADKIALLSHDGRPCPYCQVRMRGKLNRKGSRTKHQPRTSPSFDHVEPKGKQPGSRRVITCIGCNQDKGNLSLQQWLSVLTEKNDPRRPIVKDFINRNL